jgi:cytochrome c556
MKSVIAHRRILAATVGLLLGAGVAAHAAEPEDIIKYRENVMKSLGAHLGAAGAIVQGKVDYKDQLGDHVKALEAGTKDIPGLFPKDSDFGDTEATDAVWKNNAEFVKRAKAAQEKAQALAKAVAAGDSANYGPRLKELQESCKSCHKDFRKEKK